tara:strand:- start:35 stop:808 length:774 start_codon:yes stop_codon:yes gene_type:complete
MKLNKEDKKKLFWQKALKDEMQREYIFDQIENPKQSTIVFEKFFNKQISTSNNILDVGGGNGTATQYLAKKHTNVNFTCADVNDDLIKSGKEIMKNLNISNLQFKNIDAFDIEMGVSDDKYDGVISLQTFSFLSEFKQPLEEIFNKIQPKWIGISSLFYDGNISSFTDIYEHNNDYCYSYNTYSLNQIDKCCKENGYYLSSWKNFNIDFDLEKPSDPDFMKTYTEKLSKKSDSGKEIRLQISGPVLMDWKNILIEQS